MIIPAAQRSDGSYSLTLQLHPAELGTVQVHLHVSAGTVDVSFSGGSAARQALSDNLSSLRTSLEQSGLATGQVHIGDGSASGGSGTTYHHRQPAQSPSTSIDPVEADEIDLSSHATNSLSDSALDVRM